MSVVFVLALFFGLANHGYAEEKGLVGFWKFDEDKGNIVKDLSGNENNGKIHGAAWLGKALKFDGVDDYVKIPASGSLNTQAFTINIWLKTMGKFDRENYFLCSHNPLLRFFVKSGSHAIMVRWKKADASYVSYTFVTSSPENEWMFISMVYDSNANTLTGYKNGILGVTTPVGKMQKNFGGDLNIGHNPVNKQHFNGVIDEVMIYNRPLTAGEIKNYYDTQMRQFDL